MLAAEVIKLFAEATGIDTDTIYRRAYALQLAGIWPKGARGNSPKRPHLDPSHLTALLLSVFGGAVASAGPQDVAKWRSLAKTGVDIRFRGLPNNGTLLEQRYAHDDGGMLEAILQDKKTLGESIDDLIHSLQKPENQGIRHFLRKGGLRIELDNSRIPAATMTFRYQPSSAVLRARVEVTTYQPAQLDLSQQQEVEPPGFMCGKINFAMIDLLIDAWDHTLRTRERLREFYKGAHDAEATDERVSTDGPTSEVA